MNKTNIEWAKNPDGSQGYTWNPITGCQNHDNNLCKGGGFPCYAYKLANGRLKPLYLANTNLAPDAKGGVMTLSISGRAATEREGAYADPFYPRFWEERLEVFKKRYKQLHSCITYPKKLGIFPCDMGDLFGIGVPEEWTRLVLEVIRINGYDRFYLLTKQPQNLIKFSPFPDNCFVGVTATNGKMVDDAGYWLERIDAKVKYLSLEPLLEPIHLYFGKPGINWLIIGALTFRGNIAGKYPDLTPMSCGRIDTLQPRIEWVQEIVEAADKAGIRVFLKDNLRPLLIPEDGSKPNYLLEDIFWASEKAQLRQEMPIVKKEEAQCSLCD